ncbi:MAG: tRNA-dihydrouridine synthase family protein, partial [Bacteroidaceae bacterium]|nr:tRNA-dihydrouridine synthase family protein [Bacteroidaceae bacterium]
MARLPIHFAPLQGYTEDVFRRAHHQVFGGVATYYSPFIRLEHGDVRSKDLRDLRAEHNAGIPVTPQAIAASAEELERLIDVIREQGYHRLDLNMGCPFPLQTKHGRGAGLLPHPDRVEALCRLMASTPDIEFSVKMRLGLQHPDEWKPLLPLLNATPLRHITLHPRIASQQYRGTVDRTSFAAFLDEARHPVVFNGDIVATEQIGALEKEFPTLAGVMIGRGLLARPWLAHEYANDTTLSAEQRLDGLRKMHAHIRAAYERIIPGSASLHHKMRTLWDYAEPAIERKAWKKITKAGNLGNYLAAVEALT